MKSKFLIIILRALESLLIENVSGAELKKLRGPTNLVPGTILPLKKLMNNLLMLRMYFLLATIYIFVVKTTNIVG